MNRVRLLSILLVIGIVAPYQLATADSAPKLGTSCKSGQMFNANGVNFKCIKSGSKYVWSKGSTSASSTSNNGGGSGRNNGNASGGFINVGDPCDKENQEAPLKSGTAICLKVNGILKWQTRVASMAGNQNGQGSFTTGVMGGSTILSQNADGTWQTLPGYPTDVAAPGNEGASWFQGNLDIYTAQPTLPACSTKTPIVESPAKLDEIVSIVGQGYMQPGSHNLPVAHMYWNTAPSNDVDANGLKYVSARVKIYAPADMTLRTFSKSTVARDGKTYSEYGSSFSLCGNYWVTWGHLGEMSQELLDASKKAAKHECLVGGQNSQSQDCYDEYISYRVKAGTYIGMSSGRAGGFDLGFYDTSSPNKNVLDPHSFKGRISTGRCVMNYAVEPLKSNLMAKLIGDNGCGGVGYDLPGTISGVWLNPDHVKESVIEDLHIALVPHWSDSTKQVFAIGEKTSIPGLGPGLYVFTPQMQGPNNRQFSSINAGEVACYDHLTGWLEGAPVSVGSILVKSKTGSAEEIYIAGSASACAAGQSVMPSKFATFTRKNLTP